MVANNKDHDNRGIGAPDQEQLRRLSERQRGATETSPHVKSVPREATKPGRPYDTSNARRRGGARAEGETLGGVRESNEGSHVGHRNR